MCAVSPCLVLKISQSSARIPWKEAELQKMLRWSREQEREGRQYHPLQKVADAMLAYGGIQPWLAAASSFAFSVF